MRTHANFLHTFNLSCSKIGIPSGNNINPMDFEGWLCYFVSITQILHHSSSNKEQKMPRVLGKLFIFIFFLVSGFFWLPLAHAEGGFFGTESIRSQLFGRMDDKKEKKTLRTVSENIVEGVFSRMTDSESVWVRIDNRNEFRKWTFKLSKMNLNLPRQEIRVWLKYVSPKLSISHGKKYNDWFRKKAAFETQKIFYNRSLRINYDYSESLYRLDGMLWTGDTNINVWIIRKGWSYYLLQEEPPPGHNDFLAAEKEAQKLKIGLWKPELQ